MNLEAALASLASPAPSTLEARVDAATGLADLQLVVDGPTGPLRVAFGKAGASLVAAAATASPDDEHQFASAFAARYPQRRLHRAPPDMALPRALLSALSGGKAPKCDLSSCSPFQRAVLEKTAQIPRGQVRPYGWVAREVGHEGATRAVGTALGRNPVPVLVPCHRVVRTDGHIGNYALGPDAKRRLLAAEGVDLDELARLAASGARFTGVTTTGVFCLPTCHHVRRSAPAHRVMFPSALRAADAGYRPCLSCRPAPVSTT
jgi:O-6-methylguanine DNA methyltransferase